jgi:hypothetical protein
MDTLFESEPRKQKFSYANGIQRQLNGLIAEQRGILALLEAGYDISIPMNNYAKYDAIIDTDEGLKKVQIKTGRIKGTYVEAGITTRTGRGAYQRSGDYVNYYEAADFDYLGIACLDNDKFYLVPASVLDLTKDKATISINSEYQDLTNR